MDKIEKKISYTFKNRALLKTALTHPSLQNLDLSSENYEIFEFLGDSVLNLVITEYLVLNYSAENEGNLAKRKAALISGKVLAQIANSIKLGENILMADSEEATGGRDNPNNLEDTMEALIGAIYLDGGLEEARKIIIKYWAPIAQQMIEVPSNPKTKLQEWSQSFAKGIPEYNLISTYGPPHSPIFEIEVSIQGERSARGVGSSKKVAETDAARNLMDEIEKYDRKK